jgi:PPOX class probable F420-dependent enzyme
MTLQEVWAFLGDQRVVFVSTVDRLGRPHTTPVWFTLENDKLYFRSQPYKQKIRNLRDHPWVSCSAHAGDRYTELRGVTITARARIVEEPELRERIQQALVRRYASERNYAGMPPEWRRRWLQEARVIVELTPTKTVSWDNRKWATRPG